MALEECVEVQTATAKSSEDGLKSMQQNGGLVRELNWRGAFWVAAGVPPLIMFSLGGVAAVAGKASWVVWIISSLMGFSQSFTYAEMAGMFASKSGGASVYGAMAWLRYSKFIAPLSVWCNWLAWSPVMALSCSLGAGYILKVVDYMQIEVKSWNAVVPIPALGSLNFNLTFVIGALLMSATFAIQHGGISSTKCLQKWLAIVVLVPFFLSGILPILLGHIQGDNLQPLVPPASKGSLADGSWTDQGSWTLILGALFIAAWTTYAFETTVCYTSELKNPKRDTVKTIASSGIVCCAFFCIVPFAFQGVLGLEGELAPDVADGTGIPGALASMIGGWSGIKVIFTILMLPGLFLCVMTAMAGSSRTLYQGSVDGWLPKYLASVNKHGAPTGAMLTDFVLNMFLLALASDPEGFNLIMACSNVFYITFNFLNLNAGWIHRIDSPHIERPWKAPMALIAFNTFLAYVNALFLGAGVKAWGYPNALWIGFVVGSLIFPVFAIRHYVQDGGVFPEGALRELKLEDGVGLGERKAGVLPYLALVVGLAIVLCSHCFMTLP